ncbi:nucleotidyltransferase domain-containing protein [bacterium]|nr:nucleotidyltransferase domain-containing protein [bacterium]
MQELPALLRERLPVEELRNFCLRHPIQEMWVFGSVLENWRPDSDVDLLVRFLPNQDVFLRFDLEEELERMLGRKVDLVEADSVSNPFVRKHIREHRVQIYAA